MHLNRKELMEMVGKRLYFSNISLERDLVLASTDYKAKTENPLELIQQFDHCGQAILIDKKPLVFSPADCHGEKRIQNTFHHCTVILPINARKQILFVARSTHATRYGGYLEPGILEHSQIYETPVETAMRTSWMKWHLRLKYSGLYLALKAPTKDEIQWQWITYYLFDAEQNNLQTFTETKGFHWIPIEQLRGKDLSRDFHFRPDHSRNVEYIINNIEMFFPNF